MPTILDLIHVEELTYQKHKIKIFKVQRDGLYQCNIYGIGEQIIAFYHNMDTYCEARQVAQAFIDGLNYGK